MARCPNKNTDSWRYLVENLGEDGAYKVYLAAGEDLPSLSVAESIVKEMGITPKSIENIAYKLKAIPILQSDKAIQIFAKGKKNNWNIDKILQELAIPKEQKQLLIDSYNEGNKTPTQLAIDIASKYSYSVEVKTAKSKGIYNRPYSEEDNQFEPDFDEQGIPIKESNIQEGLPTQHYSNLTVPGGTNYTENRIITPQIVPNIKGHAQFAEKNDLGWSRSDDKAGSNKQEYIETDYTEQDLQEAMINQDEELYRLMNTTKKKVPVGNATKTRRILELQSDLFQKGRDKEFLTEGEFEKRMKDPEIGHLVTQGMSIEDIKKEIIKDKEATKQNQFLQLLNKDSNWVTFFIKSIIQDSAKKGYEKVLFPKGETAAKIEGHETLANEIRKIDVKLTDAINLSKENVTELQQQLSTLKEKIEPYTNQEPSLNREDKKKYNIENFQWNRVQHTNYREGQHKDKLGNYEGYYIYAYTVGKDNTIIKISDTEAKRIYNYSTDGYSRETSKAINEVSTKIKRIKNINNEIAELEQKKQELKSQGIEKLKPIEAFYEIKVGNILEKQFGKDNVKTITDEFGNEWREVTIEQERDLNDISLADKESDDVKVINKSTLSNVEDAINEVILSEETQLTIEALENRINIIRAVVNKKPENVNKLKDNIKALEKEIEAVIDRNEITDTLGRLLPDRLKAINRKMYDSDTLSAMDVQDIDKEVAVWNELLNKFTKAPIEGEDTTVFYDETLQEQIGELKAQFNRIDKRLFPVKLDLLKTQLNAVSSKEFTDSDLTQLKNVNIGTRQGLDLTRVHDRLGKGLAGLMQRSDRSAMSEYNYIINKQLDEHIKAMKKDGYDITKQEVLNMFLQEDKNGDWTGYSVDMFSQTYYDDRAKWTKEKKYIATLDDSKYRRDKLREWREWERKNRLIIDPTIFFDEEHSNYSEKSQVTQKEWLISEIGKHATEKLIENARRKWDKWLEISAEYKNTYKNEINTNSDYANVTQEERDTAIQSMYEAWESENSPIEQINLLNGSSSKVHLLANKGEKYLEYAPRTKGTEYYDKKYAKIMETDSTTGELKALGKFYDWYAQTMHDMRALIPYFSQNKLQGNFMVDIAKSLLELQQSGDLNISSDIMNRMIDMFSSEEAANSVHGELDADGKPVKRIPVLFTSDKIGVANSRIRALRSRENYLSSQLAKANKALQALESKQSTALPEEITQKKAQITELNKELAEIPAKLEKLTKERTELLRNKSTDMIQGLKMFSMMAINYKHKAVVEDIVNIGKSVMDEAVEIQMDANNENLTNKRGRLLKVSNGLVNLREMTEYSINSLLYGEKRNDDTLLKRKMFKDDETRLKANAIRKEMRKTQRAFYREKISDEEYDIKFNELNDQLSELEGFRHANATKMADFLVKYTQLKGIGYNPTSSLTNLTFGLMADSMHASTRLEYDPEHYHQALGLMLNSTRKSLGLGTSNTAQKINSLIEKYNILFEINESAYGTKTQMADRWKKMGLLIPFELQKRGEYFVQGTVLVASMLKKKVTVTVDGKEQEVSLFEVYDDNGNWKSKYGTEPAEWTDQITGDKVNEYTKFRDNIIQLNKRLHGNYDPSSPIELKRSVLGRMLMQFRTWIPEGIATRFEEHDFDEMLGRDIKGRYRTIHNIGYVNSATILARGFFAKGGGNAVNSLEEIDKQNMRKNLTELRWLVGLMMFGALLTAMLGNLEDDDDDKLMYVTRLMINQAGRLQSDITFYLSPNSFEQIIKNPIPIAKTYIDVSKFFAATSNVIFSDNKRYDDEYWIKSLARTIPVGTNVVSAMTQASKIY